MRMILGVGALIVASAGSAQAQIQSKPIDTEALVIRPVAKTTSIVGNTVNFVSRVTADVIDNNALIRSVNKLFGSSKSSTPTTQGGLSPLPAPSQYQSSYYKSPIQPVFPSYQILKR